MRLDNYLFEKKLVRSRSHAKSLIQESKIKVNNFVITKPNYKIKFEDIVEGDFDNVVGRGYYKLAGAIKNVNLIIENKICLDIGSSTGGFTQCLIENEAQKVYAFDVGTEQFDKNLLSKNFDKIILNENTDIRSILNNQENKDKNSNKKFENFFDIIVCDVSFISILSILDVIKFALSQNGKALLLIKPQFEVGRANTKKGIVKDLDIMSKTLETIKESFVEEGFLILDFFESSIKGGDGNTEYFLFLERS